MTAATSVANHFIELPSARLPSVKSAEQHPRLLLRATIFHCHPSDVIWPTLWKPDFVNRSPPESTVRSDSHLRGWPEKTVEIRPVLRLWYVQWIVFRLSVRGSRKSNGRIHESSAPTSRDMLWIQKERCVVRAFSSTTSFSRSLKKSHPNCGLLKVRDRQHDDETA
jgi:hypothetical protein